MGPSTSKSMARVPVFDVCDARDKRVQNERICMEISRRNGTFFCAEAAAWAFDIKVDVLERVETLCSRCSRFFAQDS